ncbi:hypothetical protein KAS41_04610 [Candidatus Parcubacteria bacterium]|nr:hypothetical protein [Candidatus Parcubacteria bacterium]
MKKIKDLIFSQKGKEKPIIRLYIVLIYTALILGTIFTFAYCLIETNRQNILHTDTVQKQLSWALLDPIITSDTVGIFMDANVSSSESNINLNKYKNGYEYKNYLIYDKIPQLASQLNDSEKAKNIKKVASILEQNIKNYSSGRLKVFSPSSAIIDGLLFVITLIIPLFIFFRTIVYYILLYIIFGKTKS